MFIKEIAKKCNITKKAVQYYVEQGLISPEILQNGYQCFTEQDEIVLKQIALYRKLGLSVSEIKAVLHNSEEVTHILHRRTLELEQEKVKQEFLKRLTAGEKVENLEREINTLSSNTIIIKKLVDLFPGYYGKLISLHFSGYLTGEIETEEQMQAFIQMIEFFDNVPDVNLPEDLQQYLDEYLQEYESEDGADRISHIFQEKEKAIQDIDLFVEKNKEILAEYKMFRQTEEYKNLPAVRLMEYMKQFCSTSGYYDVFIPAMRKLSPLYDVYYEQLLKANEIFMESYPEYLE